MSRNHGRLVLVATVAGFLVGCHESGRTIAGVTPTAKAVIAFDSGQGTGPYDAMTYFKYGSEIAFTPSSNMTVGAIRPQIWYCNGSSGFLAIIRDVHSQPLAAEAGLVDGTGALSPTFSDRHFDARIQLEAGTTYLISMEVWTTKSVGIFTTGSRTTGSVGTASYVVTTATITDRGAIAFQLIE